MMDRVHGHRYQSDHYPEISTHHMFSESATHAASRAHTTRLASTPGIGTIVHPALRESLSDQEIAENICY